MSRRMVEREALFYLIDIGAGSGSSTVYVNPLSKTAKSLGGLLHTDLRMDGAYVQRSPTSGAFVGYYIFSDSEEVRYRSINNLNANELVYARPCRYTKLNHPWLVMHWGHPNSSASKMIASVQPYGLAMEWRYPPRPDHLKRLELLFYPSYEPMVGTLFSDEIQQRPSTMCQLRFFFHDRARVQVSLIERGRKKISMQKMATYTCEVVHGLCFVVVRAPWFEMRLLSLGAVLVEVGMSTATSGGNLTKFSFVSKAVRIFGVVGTTPDTPTDPDEIDIYEFLRTYHPEDRAGDDSSEVDDEPQSTDEPFLFDKRRDDLGGMAGPLDRMDM